jgi:uncharacterized protein (DUF58 family)
VQADVTRFGEALRAQSRTLTSANLPEPIVVLSALLALVGLATGSVQLTVVSATVLAAVVFARLWTRLSLKRVSLQRTLSRRRAFVGDHIEVEMQLDNRKVLPLPWLRLHFTLPDGLSIGVMAALGTDRSAIDYRQSFYEVFSLGKFERVRAVRPILAERRGSYRLGAATLETGDLFGFFATRASTRTHPDELVVFPKPRTLPGFALPGVMPDGAGRGFARFHEDVSRPRGGREYYPGDPVNHIDWKASARRQHTMLRTFDPSVGHRVVILLECGTSATVWRAQPELLEAAVIAAASIALMSIEAGHQVALITNGLPLTAGRPILRPASGTRQLEEILHALARVQTIPAMSLVELLQQQCGRQLGDLAGSVFVNVTAFTQLDTLQWLERQCRRGARAQCVFVGNGPVPASTRAVPVYDFSGECQAAPGGSGSHSPNAQGAAAVSLYA